MEKQTSKHPKVAFILSQFPEQYETFLLREIVELEKTNISLHIFSLKKCKDEVVHPEAKRFLKKTYYSNFLLSSSLLLSNIYFLLKNPLRYLKTLFFIIKKNLASFDFLLKSLVLFPISIHYAFIIKEKNIDIVHGYWATHPTTSAFVISRLLDIPFSFTGHAHDIYVDKTMLLEKMIEAKFISTCTAHNKTYLLDFACEFLSEVELKKIKDKIYPIYHGVDIKKFKTPKSKFDINKEKIKIISVGSLLPCKGFDLLIDACAKIKRTKAFPFQCVIVGGGPLMKELKNQVKENKLQNEFTFTGNLPQNEVIPYYKEADIFALPIRLEIHWGIPNVVIEAAAAHTVVITGALPSIPELIVDQKTGFIVPEENSQVLAEKIKILAKNNRLRKRMADAAHSIILKKFNRSINAQKLAHTFIRYTD